MSEIRKGSENSTVEGGARTYPTNEGNVHTVKNEGSSDHVTEKPSGPVSGRKGVNKVKGKT